MRIGLLAPPVESPEWLEGRSMQRGAELAVAEAGGWEGLPFRLLLHPDLPIWGASSNEIVAMSWDEKVWAILGSVDPLVLGLG
ncbi:MAG: hypothetical protein GY856_12560 [bacterium]|nr:hypothetical protein [bacterium]